MKIPSKFPYNSFSPSSNISGAKMIPTLDLLIRRSTLMPKLTKPGYYTEPSMVTLCSFTEEELANVEEFSIYNTHAKIIFKGKTDIRKFELDKIVVISHQSVII